MRKEYFHVLLLILLSVFYQSCGREDDITTEREGISCTSEELIGFWNCIYQEWDDNGDIDRSNYSTNSAYYIIFRDDFTGSTHAGREELMEWGGARDFNWSILDGRIIDVGYGTQWIVKSITENELELLWEDIEDNGEWYKITCKFKRKE